MKNNNRMKHLFLLLAVAIGFAACSKSDDPPAPPAEVGSISIEELKSLSTATTVTLPDGRKIKGIVISDASAGNIDAKTIILQEATGKPGIIVHFDASHTFALGDEVEINISKQALAQVSGEIVLQHIPVASAAKKGTGSITARETTIADIIANKAAWNGTLVSVAATELTSPDGKYKGSLAVKDTSGSLTSAVIAGAAFENENLPASISKLTGIVRINGSDVSVDLRNTADVVAGAITRSVTIDFSTITDSTGAAIDFSDPMAIYNAYNTVKFKTNPDVGVWGLGGNGFNPISNVFPVQNLPGDEAITNGKPYFYLPIQEVSYLGLTAVSPSLKGLRTVTVTFAYSQAPKVYLATTLRRGLPPSYNTINFDPAVDKIRIGLSTFYVEDNKTLYYLSRNNTTGEDAFEALSPEYTEPGKEYTFTYTLPTAAEAKVDDATLEKYLQRPGFVIFNKCITSKSEAASIIIKKVVLGFSE